MLRSIVGVMVGYLVMAALVLLTFAAVYLALGADLVFLPGSYDVSATWLAGTFLLGFLAAVVGGAACDALSRNGTAAVALAVLVLLLGLGMGAAAERAPDELPTARTGDVPNLEAMQKGRQPVWVTLVYPFVGVVGVLAGARLRRPA